IKVADDEADAAAAAKFTGLSKEELLKVAGSPGWVRTRWALLLLFWLGWLGMLAGAVGALYRIGDLQAFQGRDAGDLVGLKGRLDYLSTLKVKGFVLGPIHENQKDDLTGTNLEQIAPTFGSKEDFDSLLQSAKKKSGCPRARKEAARKGLAFWPEERPDSFIVWFIAEVFLSTASSSLVLGIRVILDLTPNYKGQNLWFHSTQIDTVATKVKEALRFWLQAGVDGFQVRDVGNLTDAPSFLAEWQNITKSFSEDRLLIAGTDSSDLQQILSLLESAEDLLLTSSYLSTSTFTGKHTNFLVTQYLDAFGSRWCSWSLSQSGLLTSFVPPHLLRLYQLLLFTLPGTPVFSYGDEIGLEEAALPGQPVKAPVMLWDESSFPNTSGPVNTTMTVKGQSEEPGSLLSLFRWLSDQRGEERSLLHGDFHALSSGPDLFAYIRQWDQNERFLIVLNFGDVGQPARLGASNLPAGASLPASGYSLDCLQMALKRHDGNGGG
ncbi:hypothetical protein E2I00_019041, partial [Balaenoptera physalus]